MSGLRRTASTEAVRASSPPSPKERQLRPLPHRSPSSATVVGLPPKPVALVRPELTSRPSVSAFVTSLAPTKTGHRYAIQGNCLQCMAQMRDAYDKAHAEHVTQEARKAGD